jgi:hypothetical protein
MPFLFRQARLGTGVVRSPRVDKGDASCCQLIRRQLVIQDPLAQCATPLCCRVLSVNAGAVHLPDRRKVRQDGRHQHEKSATTTALRDLSRPSRLTPLLIA